MTPADDPAAPDAAVGPAAAGEPFDDGTYVLKRFAPGLPGTENHGATRDWLRAVGAGFYDKDRDDAYLDAVAAMFAADERELTGVYARGPVPAGTLGEHIPVATFATLRKTLNAGFGRLVPAHLITAVTVRTSHRRRGLLRRLMSADLARAKGDGVPVAALNASEGSIYRRFGFGVATSERSITVDTTLRFALNTAPAGHVEAAHPSVLLDLGPRIFGRVHRLTPGSIDRHERYRLAGAGRFSHDGGPDPALRAALHLGPDGQADGYVVYSFRGWDVEPYTVEVKDLVAATHAAYLGLWEFLGALDLVERVVWREAPADDPLVWALEDPRCVAARAAQDMLWLRILDVEAALSARAYDTDGELVLSVTDPLSLASGTYRLAVRGGAPRVTRLSPGGTGMPGSGADVQLDVADLSSVYCGGVSPVTLAAAGRFTELRHGAALEAMRLFAVERPAHCLTHF